MCFVAAAQWGGVCRCPMAGAALACRLIAPSRRDIRAAVFVRGQAHSGAMAVGAAAGAEFAAVAGGLAGKVCCYRGKYGEITTACYVERGTWLNYQPPAPAAGGMEKRIRLSCMVGMAFDAVC